MNLNSFSGVYILFCPFIGETIGIRQNLNQIEQIIVI
jgi:hypothetical protein